MVFSMKLTNRSEVQDLLSLIFANFLPEDPTALPKEDISQGRRQLHALALTCRSFRDPALDRLWTCLDSLIPLIKVLPNLRTVSNSYYFYGGVRGDTPIRRHASRVRVLDLRPVANASLPSASLHAFVLLTRELEGQELFPLLRKICFKTSEDPTNQFAVLPLVFSRSVETVNFSGRGISNALFLEYCLPLAGQRLTFMKHLSLHHDLEIDPSVFNIILQFVNLESLALHFPRISNRVTPDVLVKAGKAFKQLTSLTLDLHFPNHQVSAVYFSAVSPLVGLFPKLTSFHATSRSEGRLCKCIPPFLLEKSTSLTLIVTTHIQSALHFEESTKILSNIPTLKGLEILDTEVTRVHIQESRAILPFLQRLSLVEFKVDVSAINYGFSNVQALVDGAFQSLYRAPGATPTLKTLYLPAVSNLGSQLNNPVTLASLSDIAQQAIGLERLVVGLESNDRVSKISGLLLYWRLQRPSPSTLRYLSIRELKALASFNVQEYNDLAQLLDLMFPLLVSIKPYCDSDVHAPYWKSHWWFIEHLRKMYKELRLYRASS